MASKKTETTSTPAASPAPIVTDRDIQRREKLVAAYETRLKDPKTSDVLAKHLNRRLDEEKATVKRLSKSK